MIDESFLRRRAEEHLGRALQAQKEQVAKTHKEFAQQYAARADQLKAGVTPNGSMT